MTDIKKRKTAENLSKLDAFEQKILKGNKKTLPQTKKKTQAAQEKSVNKIDVKKVPTPKEETSKTNKNVKIKPKKKKPARKLVFSVCNSKKSCGEHYGPYIWERLCNENNEDASQDEFEKNGITYKKSACQGRCKKASNIRVEEPAKEKITQFSYMTPLKAAKLAKSLNSGAAPENIKKL